RGCADRDMSVCALPHCGEWDPAHSSICPLFRAWAAWSAACSIHRRAAQWLKAAINEQEGAEKSMRTANLVITGSLVAGLAVAASAQQPPPIPGTTGTVDGTVDRTSEGAHTVIVTTLDGVKHLFRWTKSTTVHGATDAASAEADALKD